MKTQQTTFAIGIPTINRADLLQEALEKMQHDFPNTAIYIFDNGNQDFDVSKFSENNNVFMIASETNLGVASSWNELLFRIYNGVPGFSEPCSHAMILNDDIYLGRTEKEVEKFIVENPITLATTTGTWCAFILSKIVFLKVGHFDAAFFPAYYEDNDYAYRLKLLGYDHTCHEFLNPEVYRNSQSIAKQPELNERFGRNKEYYIKKWGGEPYQETYLAPFNNLDKF